MVVEFLKKIVKSIKSMITDDSIAAAQMAQIFGSELLKVQQSLSDSRTQTDIVRLNPKHFLLGDNQHKQQQTALDRQLAEALQREAEAMHPLPQPSPPAPVYVRPPVSVPLTPVVTFTPVTPAISQEQLQDPLIGNSFLERIALSLERIANKLESVDIKPKRKTIKRKPKSNKPILLNENHV